MEYYQNCFESHVFVAKWSSNLLWVNPEEKVMSIFAAFINSGSKLWSFLQWPTNFPKPNLNCFRTKSRLLNTKYSCSFQRRCCVDQWYYVNLKILIFFFIIICSSTRTLTLLPILIYYFIESTYIFLENIIVIKSQDDNRKSYAESTNTSDIFFK